MRRPLTPAERETQRALRAAVARAKAEHWPAAARRRLVQAYVAWQRQRTWQGRAS